MITATDLTEQHTTSAVYLAGEGGSKRQPGTFVQFACTANQ